MFDRTFDRFLIAIQEPRRPQEAPKTSSFHEHWYGNFMSLSLPLVYRILKRHKRRTPKELCWVLGGGVNPSPEETRRVERRGLLEDWLARPPTARALVALSWVPTNLSRSLFLSLDLSFYVYLSLYIYIYMCICKYAYLCTYKHI